MRFSLDDGARSRAGSWVTRLRLLGMACLALMAMTTEVAALDSVSVTPGVSVAYEANQVPGTFIVTRTGSTGALDVNFSLSGTATLPGNVGADYAISPALTGATTGTVSFIQGESSKTITITPVDDNVVEGRESVMISINPSANYIIGTSPSAQITIADNDMTATIQVTDSIATEDTISGFVTDPDLLRRGVLRVKFSQPSFTLPSPRPIVSGPTFSLGRTLTVQFGGRATLGTDYTVKRKVCGNDNTTVPATGNLSQVGFDTGNGNRTTGVNYRIYAHLIGESVINVTAGSAPIPVNATLKFSDVFPSDPNTYTVTASSTSATVPGTITISPPLLRNLPAGAGVGVTGASPPTGYSVVGYPLGTTTVKVGDGPDGIFRGDVMTFAGDTATYVALSDTDLSSGQGPIDFYRFEGGGVGSGLSVAVSSLVEVTTLLDVPLAGNIGKFNVPPESTRVDFSIVPTADGLVEGAEDVTVTIVGDLDYAIQNPTVGTVLIADVDAFANVTLGSNAGKPSTSGSFLVTLSSPFPIPITVPYSISPGSTATPGVDYVPLSGSITIPAGQTTGTISVNPLNTPANGLTTVTISLDSTLDYKLLGSGSSGTNPSATVNITDSLGSVGIAATIPSALENPTAPVPGMFTVTLNRNGPGAISVNYIVTGTAAAGSRYVPLSGSVIIPAGQNTAQIPVTPVDNLVADGNQSVVVTLAGGQGYSVDPLAQGAQVTIVDDEPLISAVRVSDAIEPSTPGIFQVSYPGVPAGTPLNRSVVVNYTLSGTAIAGTDFTGSSSVTIPANSLSAQVLISPLGNTAAVNKTVTLTVSPSTAYTIGNSSDTLTISQSPQVTAAQSKPAPGSIDTGKGTGCGHGSGFATLIGLALLGLGLAAASLRRNR